MTRQFKNLNLGVRKFQHLKIAKISLSGDIMLFQIIDLAIFETLDLPELISRKILVAVMFSNFHTVLS